MVKYKCIIIIGLLSLTISFSVLYFPQNSYTHENNTNRFLSTSGTNYDLIENVMNEKLSELISQGYTDQHYQSSIQATYYALASLEKLGKLTEVNFSEIINFIMTYYNTTTKLFMDKYTKRYLDTDYNQLDFPLNSLLLTNCYAVLALNITGNLGIIDIDVMKSFIWSCYNPETSGFIGLPYSITLQEEWRISTMDNTYYAVLTYNLLSGGDWSSKNTQKNAIIDYVESLQDIAHGGGFHNDVNPNWDSLDIGEPNIYASYYCIRTLEIFNWIPAINVPAFHNYLKALYYETDHYFEVKINSFFINKTNVVSTTLGLALCALTENDTFINSAQVINFIISHRNPEGGFYRSSISDSYELLDLYQILTGLKIARELNVLNIADKQELADFINLYKQLDNGFAPISKNFMSISLLHNIIGTFELFERTSELPIQDLYSIIMTNLVEFRDVFGFCCCDSATSFRIQPLEYISIGTRQLCPQITMPRSHYSTYLSLVSLNNLRKLNDLTASYNLELFINNVIQSQFLNPNYTQNFGGFTHFYNTFTPSNQNKMVNILYTFYGIKVMEFIAEELGLGQIITLGFDVDALDTYILRHLTTTSTVQFFSDEFETTPEDFLEDTYYAAYILNAINRNTLNMSKLQTFININLNYSNLKNIYFCFKLSKILNLNIDFDTTLVHSLIQTIYSTKYNEFYLTEEMEELFQDALYYLAEIAKTDHVRILADYPSEIPLGGFMTMQIKLANLILNDFGPYITVKLESEQLGTHLMDLKPDLNFTKSLQIQAIASNFPIISGNIVVYEGSSMVTLYHFQVSTTYDTFTTIKTSETPTKMTLKINASASFITGSQPILNGDAFIKVYKNHRYLDYKQFSQYEGLHSTEFSLDYYPPSSGTFLINVYLKDGINTTEHLIGQYNYTCIDPDITGGYRAEAQETLPVILFLTIPAGIFIVVSYRERLLKQLGSKKTKHSIKLFSYFKKLKSK